ncbi:MAG: hypothetical protein ACTSYD_01245 [Candidatus Heimdallarchaeaceae archaeon]
MVLKAVNGLHGGWLVFLIVLFTILAVVAITWLVLYVETSQRKSWKMITTIIILSSIIIAFDLQFILLKSNVIL